MKIVVFGLTVSSSWGNGHATPYRAIFRALHAMGHSVVFYEKDVEYYRARRDLEACDYCRIILYDEWASIRRAALDDARSAEVVVTASYLPDGRRVNDEILALEGPLHVYYDLDTPITLKNLASSGADYVRCDQIPAFDLVLSFTGGPILDALEGAYGARVARPLYGCVDPEHYRRVDPSPDFACDLSYLATYSPDRQAKMEELFLEPARRDPRRQFLLAGSMYPWDCVWPANVRRIDHVAPQAHPCFYSSSRLTLNLTRAEMAGNGWCPSGRFFEAAACGTPIVSDWWDGLDSFFDVEREIRVIGSVGDVGCALRLSDDQLHGLAMNARRRTLEEHTGQVRAGQLLTYLEEACSKPSAARSEAAP